MPNIATGNHAFVFSVPRTIQRLREALPETIEHIEFHWTFDNDAQTCFVEWDTPRWKGIRRMGKMRLMHDESIALWQEFDKHIEMPRGARYIILSAGTNRAVSLEYGGVVFCRRDDEYADLRLAKREG